MAEPWACQCVSGKREGRQRAKSTMDGGGSGGGEMDGGKTDIKPDIGGRPVGGETGNDDVKERGMGERGKDSDMKQRKSNLETLEPVGEKPENLQPVGRTATSQKPEARLGREVQARIGQQLRAMYNEVVSQGVPQHLADLVRRLSDQEPK